MSRAMRTRLTKASPFGPDQQKPAASQYGVVSEARAQSGSKYGLNFDTRQ